MLGDARLEDSLGVDLDHGNAARAETGDERCVSVCHFPREFLRAAGYDERFDHAPLAAVTGSIRAFRECLLEERDLGPGGDVADVPDPKVVAGVWTVDAVVLHRFAVRHPLHGGHGVAGHLAPEAADEALHHLHDLIAPHEGHLKVDLGELRLAVGTGVLIAEAAADLHIPVAAADHQDLLEELRRLRERVERAGQVPVGHEELTRSFGRALVQDRRLDLEKTILVEVPTGHLVQLVPGRQHPLHRGTAEVHIAIVHPELFGGQFAEIIRKEWRIVGLVQDLQPRHDDLDLAGRQFGVLTADTDSHAAFDGDHVLVAEFTRRLHGRGIDPVFGIEDELGDAETIAEIDEDQSAMVAIGVHPPIQADGQTNICLAELAASVRAKNHKFIPG